jgi:hypothetical protein
MIRQDIRLNTEFINANNDLEYYDSDSAHIQATISATPNSYKEYPNDGVAILNFLNSSGQEDFIKRKTIIQLQSDRYNCNNPTVSMVNGKLSLNPNIEL